MTEVSNNYLKHTEALRLNELMKSRENGRCSVSCEEETRSLKALSEERNNLLLSCVAKTTAACEAARMDVRAAAAEFVRNGSFLEGFRYSKEALEATALATLAGQLVTAAARAGNRSLKLKSEAAEVRGKVD